MILYSTAKQKLLPVHSWLSESVPVHNESRNTSWLKVIDIVIERKSSEKRKNFYIKNIFEYKHCLAYELSSLVLPLFGI